jgi:hypothetical protein
MMYAINDAIRGSINVATAADHYIVEEFHGKNNKTVNQPQERSRTPPSKITADDSTTSPTDSRIMPLTKPIVPTSILQTTTKYTRIRNNMCLQ